MIKVLNFYWNILRKSFPEITLLLYVVNQKLNNTIYDQDIICFYGKNYIIEEMDGLHFKIGPKSFFQTNSEQLKFFIEKLKNLQISLIKI